MSGIGTLGEIGNRARSMVAPAAGAVAATGIASVGGLIEGQAFYKLVLDSGGLAVLAFVLFFFVRRFTTLLRDELAASRTQHAAEIAALHERFDKAHERNAEREMEMRRQVAEPVTELVGVTRELINEIRHERAAWRQPKKETP